MIDHPSEDAHVARFAPEPASSAIRTRQVATVPAEEDADVDLVFLPLEPSEESAHTVEAVAALDDEALFRIGKIFPRHIKAKLQFLRRALQIGKLRAIVRLAPGLDGILRNRLRGIRYDQIHVELND